jgi:hypothetical protein
MWPKPSGRAWRRFLGIVSLPTGWEPLWYIIELFSMMLALSKKDNRLFSLYRQEKPYYMYVGTMLCNLTLCCAPLNIFFCTWWLEADSYEANDAVN